MVCQALIGDGLWDNCPRKGLSKPYIKGEMQFQGLEMGYFSKVTCPKSVLTGKDLEGEMPIGQPLYILYCSVLSGNGCVWTATPLETGALLSAPGFRKAVLSYPGAPYVGPIIGPIPYMGGRVGPKPVLIFEKKIGSLSSPPGTPLCKIRARRQLTRPGALSH